ncbi:hypothetical protein Trydic_g18912 [Trypoxylus dichotomus]
MMFVLSDLCAQGVRWRTGRYRTSICSVAAASPASRYYAERNSRLRGIVLPPHRGYPRAFWIVSDKESQRKCVRWRKSRGKRRKRVVEPMGIVSNPKRERDDAGGVGVEVG